MLLFDTGWRFYWSGAMWRGGTERVGKRRDEKNAYMYIEEDEAGWRCIHVCIYR